MNASFYPVHVDAHIDPQLSRWQWLFKWLLALPHYFVLAFLWIAFVVLSVIAFFAILFTGRYPRGIFDFNVGVLRWTWRVGYYAYGANGTDRYPPFSLDERPDYPAHLEIDYPEHLSPGLALVKWWLLAIPHYLVLAVFLGGAGWAFEDARNTGSGAASSGGLIGILVLVAAVVLLFTGRYPQPIFDLVLGLNRWVLRVAAYAGLMTDVYPPFRLDQGGDDPSVLRATGTPPSAPAAGPTAGPAATSWPADPAGPAPVARASTVTPTGVPAPVAPGPTHRWTAGRVVALVAGSVLVLGALGLGIGGGALAFIDQTQRDDEGFLMSANTQLATTTYAITSKNVVLHADGAPTGIPQRLIGDLKITVHTGPAVPVFVGIASTRDVKAYLGDVEHATLTDITDRPVYDVSGQAAPSTPPTGQDIWVAQAVGTGDQQLVWPVTNGDWTLVLMNADGSREVVGDVAVGAEVPALGWLGPLLLTLAAVGLVVGSVVLVLALRRRNPPTPA